MNPVIATLVVMQQATARLADDIAIDALVVLESHPNTITPQMNMDGFLRILDALTKVGMVTAAIPACPQDLARFYPPLSREYRLTRRGHTHKCNSIRELKIVRIPRKTHV